MAIYGRMRPGETDWWCAPARHVEAALARSLGRVRGTTYDEPCSDPAGEREGFRRVLRWLDSACAGDRVRHVVIADWAVLADDRALQREAVETLARLGATIHAALADERVSSLAEFDALSPASSRGDRA